MTVSERHTEQLTPQERRTRLRTFADRMLMALSNVDDPETGNDVAKGMRLALMIERLYARCDISEALASKRAAEARAEQERQAHRAERASASWNPVADLKAEVERLRAAANPKAEPAQKHLTRPKLTPEELTPKERALRERVLAATPIPKPDHVDGLDHDYGLIRDEDVELIHAGRLTQIYAGRSREAVLIALKACTREELIQLRPDLFSLDTG
ncbi:MAG: hypothetical protein QM667_07900 [Asticcacaulis sp.]